MYLNRVFFVLVVAAFTEVIVGAQTLLPNTQLSCPDANTPEEERGFRIIKVQKPRIQRKNELRIAGVNAFILEHNAVSFERIPEAYSVLLQQFPRIEGKTNVMSPFTNGAAKTRFSIYEVCFGNSSGGGFNYMPGVQVKDLKALKPGMTGITLPPRTYAVFSFEGLREDIGNFRYSLTKVYWKSSKYTRIQAPNIAVFPPDDDQSSAKVKMEMWVAIKP
jgi:predicted transcriptional regulator YdeE